MSFSEAFRLAARIAFLICLATFDSRAQDTPTKPGEDLEPVPSAYSDHSPQYRMKVRSLLLAKAPWNSCLQFLALPSFDPECLLSISNEGVDYRGMTTRPDRQLWSDKRADAEVVVKQQKKAIPAEVAKRAIALWSVMLGRTRYQKHRGVDLDGVQYVFLAWEDGCGSREGKASNPREGTRGWWLATIGELLTKYVEAPAAAEADLLKELAKAMDSLEALLKESDNKDVRPAMGK